MPIYRHQRAQKPRRRLRLRSVLLPLAAAWLGAVGALAILAYRDLRDGAAALETMRSQLDLASLASGDVAVGFREAHVQFESGRSRVTNPLLLPLRPLPVIGRHMRSVAALADAASDVTRAAERAVRDASGVLSEPPASAEERLEALERLQGVVRVARDDLKRVRLGPSRALVSTLATRRHQFASQLSEARTALSRADAALVSATDLLRGPKRYLLLVGSNAEMRAGSGTFLSVGVLETAGGSFSLRPTVAAGDITLREGVAIEDADFAARWGWLEPNREWRNLGVSPRFPANAQVAAAMWKARSGEDVDGVLALDVETVRVILAATGPVDAGGRTIRAEEVHGYLMHDQYIEAGSELGGRQFERRELLGELAGAAVAAIESGDLSITSLAEGLGGAVRGRHLLAWSPDAATQRGWVGAGVSGDVADETLLLGLINRGGNKLDRFVEVQSVLARRGRDVRIDVTITNKTPPNEPAYIAGPNPLTGTAAGEYKAILAMTVPGFASSIEVDGVSPVAVAGRDGPTNVIGGELRVAAGSTGKATIRFRVPAGPGAITIGPSARLPAVSWTADGQRFTDAESRTIRFR